MFRLTAAITLVVLPGMVLAHHSRSAFDLDNLVEVEGRVVEVSWTNPHYYFGIEAADNAATRWTFEGHSIPGLVRNGWSKNTLGVGDRVRVVANPNRKPEIHFALLDSVTRQDGKTFYSFRRPAAREAQPPPPLQPSTDYSGTWRLIRSLRANLVGGFEAPTDWPLTDTGRAQVAEFDIKDDPALRCEPLGLPRMLVWPYTQRWTRTDEGMRVEIEHSTVIRTIYTSAPAHASAPEAVADDHGISVGGVNADGAFVIDTGGFADKHWGTWRGISSSDRKSVRESYQLEEGGYRMTLTYTITDPVYLTEPVVRTASFAKVHDFEFAEEPECDVFTATRHLEFEESE